MEELLQWCVIHAAKVTDEKGQALLDELQEQFEQGVQEVVDFHQQETSKENLAATGKGASSKMSILCLKAMSGPHEGTVFELHPRPRSHCWIGRSQASKYLVKGVSLFKDLEVSTSHAKIEVSKGKFYIVDLNSTNGTTINQEKIEPDTQIQLVHGMEFTCGATTLAVHLEK